MRHISQPLHCHGPAARSLAIRLDRHQLTKRRFRAQAEDGSDFAFELETPLRDGDAVWDEAGTRYLIRQTAEPVLELTLPSDPVEAAQLAWTLGNFHQPIELLPGLIRVADDPVLRSQLAKLGLDPRATDAVFRPTGAPAHGHAHSHGHA